jgi:RhoGEF domain/PH domain/Armadillo/beta-catenin-like repeat
MFATFALAHLAENDANQAAVRDLGAIPLLVPLLSSNNGEIVEKVLWLFTNLSRDPKSRSLIVGEGAMHSIFELLTSRKRSENTVHGCCKLLRNLFHEVEHQEAFVAADGINALMNLPVLTTEFPSLPLDWTILTAILTYFRPTIRRAVLEAGAGMSLASLLSSGDPGVQRYATQALANLSYDDANVEGLLNAGAGRPLVELAFSGSAARDLREHVLTVLINLAVSNDDIVSILLEDEERNLRSLFDTLQSRPAAEVTPVLRLRAAQLIATLARAENARRSLLELGILPVCERIATSSNHGDEGSGEGELPSASASSSSSSSLTGGGSGHHDLSPTDAVESAGGDADGSPSSASAAASSAASSDDGIGGASEADGGAPASGGDDGALAAAAAAAVGDGIGLAARMAVHNLNIPFSADFKRESRGPKTAPIKLDKNAQHRLRVINEVLETEKNYCANLLAVCKVYEEPLALLSGGKSNKGGLISIDERKTMFKMFDYLYRAHQGFLQSLQKLVIERHKDPSVQLGPAFLELATVLKSYRVFMNNYDSASNTLVACLKRPAFALWVENQQDQFKTKSLANLLIEPIQRIPRYLMLLNEILRKMEPDHVDYADLRAALSQIDEAANWLEAEKDKAVHKSKLIELQGQIRNLSADLTDSVNRQFVHEGQLLLETGKSKMSEYIFFFLLNDMLITASEKKGALRHRSTIPLSQIIVSSVQNEPDEGDERNAFQVLADNVDIVVSTTKAEEKAEWLEAFKRAITGNKPD